MLVPHDSLYNFGNLSYRGRWLADDSPWNSRILGDAVANKFEYSGRYHIGLTTWDVSYGNVAVFKAASSDPLLQVRWLPESWMIVASGTAKRDSNSMDTEASMLAQSKDINLFPVNPYSTQRDGKFWDTGGLLSQYDSWKQTSPVSVHIPRLAVPAPDLDGNTAILQADGSALELYSPIRLSNGTWLSQMFSFTDAYNGLGVGYENGRRASMVPNYAGLLTDEDVQAGHIDHALALVVPSSMLARTYTGPALAFDSNSRDYSGTLPMGARLFLPGSVNLDNLGLKSTLGRMVGEAAQNYGMYVVDRGGEGVSIVGQASPQSPDLGTWTLELQQDLDAIFSASAVHEPAFVQGRMPSGTYAGVWNNGNAKSDLVRFTQVMLGDDTYKAALNNGDWRADSKLSVAPLTWSDDLATHLAWASFADVRINLSAAGLRGLAVEVIGIKRGTIVTSSGNDHVVVLSQSDGGLGKTTIKTNAGDDVVRVTAAGHSNHDDGLSHFYGTLWNAAYDGKSSSFYADLGEGNDQFYADGMAPVVVFGGAGDDNIRGGGGNDRINGGGGDDLLIGGNGNDLFIYYQRIGHDIILDFASGRDRIELHGFSRANVTASAVSKQGVSGILVSFEEGSDIFFPHVYSLSKIDVLFLT
jgi:hypothetical protein